MMHDDRRGALLRLKQESRRESYADVFFGPEKSEELGLILEIRTGRIAERVARPAIFLMEEIANLRRILARDCQFITHLLVMQFGERFGGFHAETMQVEIFGVLAAFKEALRFDRCLWANGHQR